MMSAVRLSELCYWLRQPGMVVFLVAAITEMLAKLQSEDLVGEIALRAMTVRYHLRRNRIRSRRS